MIGHRAALAGRAVTIDAQRIAGLHLDMEHLFGVASAVVIYTVGYIAAVSDVLSCIGACGGIPVGTTAPVISGNIAVSGIGVVGKLHAAAAAHIYRMVVVFAFRYGGGRHNGRGYQMHRLVVGQDSSRIHDDSECQLPCLAITPGNLDGVACVGVVGDAAPTHLPFQADDIVSACDGEMGGIGDI